MWVWRKSWADPRAWIIKKTPCRFGMQNDMDLWPVFSDDRLMLNGELRLGLAIGQTASLSLIKTFLIFRRQLSAPVALSTASLAGGKCWLPSLQRPRSGLALSSI